MSNRKFYRDRILFRNRRPLPPVRKENESSSRVEAESSLSVSSSKGIHPKHYYCDWEASQNEDNEDIFRK